jgi:HD-GYP domain-containing protein (c-di-GMP phosphodiesterase class II)
MEDNIMDKLSIQDILNKKITRFSIVFLLIVIISFGLIISTFYFMVYSREKQDVENDIEYYFSNLTNNINNLERFYKESSRQQLYYIYRNYLNEQDVNIEQLMENVKEGIRGDQLLGPDIDNIYYYLINEQGVIEKTDYENDLKLDLSQFPDFWARLQNLSSGEVFLPAIDDETRTGKLKLYSYIKLPNQKIFEIGIAFDNIGEYVINDLNSLIDNDTEILLFSNSFDPFFTPDADLTKDEKELFINSVNENSIIKKDTGLFKETYYRGWHYGVRSSFNNKFVKVNVEYNSIRLISIFSILFVILILFMFFCLGKNIRGFVNKLSGSLINISKIMKDFSNDFKHSKLDQDMLDIKETNIKEIEEIKGNFFDLADEVNESYNKIDTYNKKLKSSIEEKNRLNDRFDNLISLLSFVGKSFNNDNDFLSKLLDTAIKIIPEVDYGSVYTYEDGIVNYVDCIGFDLKKLRQVNIPAENFNKSENSIEIVSEFTNLANKSVNNKDYKIIKGTLNKIKETLICDLSVKNNKKAGISIDIAADSDKTFKKDSLRVFEAFQSISETFFELKEYNKLQKQFTKELITSIIQLMEMYDTYTKGHSENVANLSVQIAERMGLSKKEKNDVYWAGMVHDIGKLLIPLSILNKSSSLNQKEASLIQKHPYWGYKALSNSKTLRHISKYILCHHERWDGKGYPEGIAKDEIPLLAQILTVADAWDAMTSKRAYRDSLSRDEAVQELIENKGTQFSPEVVDIFLEIRGVSKIV